MSIHSTAIIDPSAELDSSVAVGPYAIIGPRVQIGAGTSIGAHAVVHGPSRIGCKNTIWHHASVGTDPQDKKFQGEETWLEMGDGNTVREFVTINRGTGSGGGVTRIGDDNWIMAYVHVGHDCLIGSHCVFANSVALAGHVVVENHVIFGGYSLIHQFCRIGAYAFTGMNAKINGDVPPFVLVAGEMSSPRGINSEGLRRRGFSSEEAMAAKRAFKLIYQSGLPLKEVLEQLRCMVTDAPVLERMLHFILASERGLQR